jgi:hypothetical protein
MFGKVKVGANQIICINLEAIKKTLKMLLVIFRLGQFRCFFGRFSHLFLDYFQVKFRLFLDGLVKN